MNWLTLAWSMAAGACLVLGLMHLALWSVDRKRWESLLFSVSAVAAAGVALGEQLGLTTESVAVYRTMDRWMPVAIAVMLVSLVWFVQVYLGTGRRWLAVTISALWVLAVMVNFQSPQSMTFLEVTALRRVPTWFGGEFTVPIVKANPMQHLGNAASVLILLFLADAAMRLWRRGDRRRAAVVGGSSAFFMLAAGVHTPLVDSGLVGTPYMVSFAYLAIVAAVSYELLRAVYLSSRLSRQVRASEARWRSLLTDVQLAVISLDNQGRINLANPFLARTLGYPAAHLLGQPAVDLLAPADVEEFRQRFPIAAVQGPRPSSRWALRHADGETRTFEWSTVRLVDSTGSFDGLLAIGADVTERLKAQADLAGVRRDLDHLARTNLLGELLAALAHELNQPLTAILSNAQAGRRFLDRPAPDLGEIREILDEIVRDDKRAGEVIHRLRTLLRKEPPTRTAFFLDEALREVERLVRSEMLGSGIRLRLKLASPTPRLEGVRVDLQQVIVNLVLNAAQAVRDLPSDQREILVTSKPDGVGVRIGVLDNGPGIPAEMISSLFQPFTPSQSRGMGMGLSICRRLVENNGGRIEAVTRPEGGAAFYFTFPVAKHDDDSSGQTGSKAIETVPKPGVTAENSKRS